MREPTILALAAAVLALPAAGGAQDVHPRLLLDAGKIASLRARLETTHRALWERYQDDLPRMRAIAEGTEHADDPRYEGDLVPDLAFAWLMSGDPEVLAAAKKQLLRLTSGDGWGAREGLADLVPAHYLLGVALGYDWLYDVLTPAERTQVSARLGREAETQYRRITQERVWWRNQYFQNHSQSNHCALAFAAAALAGADERAERWQPVAERFFAKTFSVLPGDGSSLEGYAYAGYGGEYLLLYALLARDLLGHDLTGTPWMRHYAEYMLQGLLPRRTADEWAMTFGDAPRRGWTSTAQHLFTLARLHRDGAAQWMAGTVLDLREKGLGSRGWMMMLSYDPTVPTADPSTFPTFARFPEIDQVMMRSSWTDEDATLVGFKCGPFMGRTLSRDARFDYGTGHQDADSGSFQIFSHGEFLAIDPLYTAAERTRDHSTVLFKGHGQLGEQAAFGSAEALRFGHYPEIVHVVTTPDYDYVVGDVTRAYHPALGLRRFLRHLLFLKPDVLLVADQISLREEGVVHDYAPEKLQTTGGLTHAKNGYVVGPAGEAFFDFAGDPGTYRLSVVYLDNVPEAGRYSLAVDGRAVYSWASRNEDRDDHLIEVSPPVRLRRGSRVAFRGAPMAPGTRVVKMSVFGEDVKTPREAEWLLHLDPKAAVRELPDRIEARLGRAALDLFRLAPEGAVVTWGRHAVARPEAEPFTFRETERIVIRPPFSGDEAFLLSLLHARAADAPSLAGVEAAVREGRVRVDWSRGSERVGLDWDLEGRTVEMTRSQHDDARSTYPSDAGAVPGPEGPVRPAQREERR
jgi:Domain of unknown function (DUF4962)